MNVTTWNCLCGKTYKTEKAYNKHMRTKHPTPEQIEEKRLEDIRHEEERKEKLKNLNRKDVEDLNSLSVYKKRYWAFIDDQERQTDFTEMEDEGFDNIDELVNRYNNFNDKLYIFDSLERQFLVPEDIGITINYPYLEIYPSP